MSSEIGLGASSDAPRERDPQKDAEWRAECELVARVAAGDKNAETEMCAKYRPHLLATARRTRRKFRLQSMTAEDLFHAGIPSLIAAAPHFDPTRGIPYIAFALQNVKKAMYHAALGRDGVIRMTPYAIRKLQHSEEPAATPTSRQSRDSRKPSLGELRAMSRGCIPFGKDPQRADSRDILETLADKGPSPEDICLQKELSALVPELVEYLGDERLVHIVVRRFGLDGKKPATLEELREEFAVSRERIRQLENNAIKYMQSHPRLAPFFRKRTQKH